MSEFDPAQVQLLLETKSRLERLLSYAESGMKSSAVSLIKEQLLNSQSGDAGFFVGVMNSIWDTPLHVNLQDCLWALLSMKGSPALQLFGKKGLYPDLPAHEQWQKSIAIVKGTIASLEALWPNAAIHQPELVVANMESASESDVMAGIDLPSEWCEVVLWLKDRYYSNDPGSLRIFRESEAAASFPKLKNLNALWSLLEANGTIGQQRFGHFAIELPDTDTAAIRGILTTAEDVREINPSICSFVNGAVRSMRKIIPATKTDAARNVSQMLADVLAWAKCPDPHRLSQGWWDTNKANAESVLNSAVRSFDGDKNALERLREARRLAVQFLGLMYHKPTFSQVPVQDWPVKAYQRLFDNLTELEREFRNRGNAQPDAHRSETAKQKSGSTHAAPEAIPLSITLAEPDVLESRVAPEFTGPWKHLYRFLWQQEFDLSQKQDDYKAAFETYRSEFGKKKIGSKKRKRPAYKMPTSSGAKSIRQGYRRQLNRHQSRK